MSIRNYCVKKVKLLGFFGLTRFVCAYFAQKTLSAEA